MVTSCATALGVEEWLFVSTDVFVMNTSGKTPWKRSKHEGDISATVFCSIVSVCFLW